MNPPPLITDRRRFLRICAVAASAGALAASAGALAACSTTSAPPPSLDDQVAALSGRLDPQQRYRPPSDSEARRATEAVEQLFGGDFGHAAERFDGIGFSLDRIHDAASGRDYVVAAGEADTDRTWGMLVAPEGGAAPDVLIEVPHPRADLDTEQIGLDLLRAVPGAALLIAGAHRRAASGDADVAHRSDSVFHAMADGMARRGSFQLQLHGFADETLTGTDAVISTGTARVTPRSKHLAESLDDVGLDVCRAWRKKCEALEGTQNVQGRAAAKRDLDFLHLELNNATRMDISRRDAVVTALADALTT